MEKPLQDWVLIEGRIGMARTPNPQVSDVIAALEALRPDVENPFLTLEAPESVDGDYPNYCQAYADDSGYVCEIRTSTGESFTHSRAFLPDAEGNIGGNEGPFPNLSQTIRVFTGFIADPVALPAVDTVQWMDVSDEFDAVFP